MIEPAEFDKFRAHMDTRLDRLEGKMDSHLDRIGKAETEIAKAQAELSWVKGSMKIGLTFLVTIAGSIVSWFVKYSR